MMQNHQNLIEQVSALRKQYEKVAENTGENFNIFKVLKVESREVRMHSALLSELLNPNGSHGQKEIFLKLFLTQFDIQEAEFEPKNAIVKTEKFIGFKTETTGGYIDMLITDSKKRNLIIENKIYAGDQEEQLLRYHNYDRKARIFYLTLDQSEPSNIDKDRHKNVLEKLTTISYETHIIEWLENCRKEAVTHAILRESITQYINLIKHLTGQSANNIMNKEIIEKIAQNVDHVKSVFLINSLVEDLKLKLIQDLNITSQSTINLNLIKHDPKSNKIGFYFTNTNWKYCCIGFEFEGNSIFYGIRKKDDDVVIPENLIQTIKVSLATKEELTEEWWPYWEWFENYTWKDNRIFIEITEGVFIKKVEDILEEILKKLEGVSL